MEVHKSEADPLHLFLVRAGVLVVVGLLCTVTIMYSTSVYFDQNAALEEILVCASGSLEQQNVTFWLDGGTLLGAMRHNRFVVWDGDVTLGVLANVTGGLYDALLGLAARCNLHLSSPTTFADAAGDQPIGLDWYLYNSRVGLKILEWMPSRETVAGVLRHGAQLVRSVESVLPVRRCGIQSVWAACPNNGSAVLETQFGPSWGNSSLMTFF